MDAREAAGLLARGEAVALDVRTPAEWQAGRMPGALHVPMGTLGERTAELPRDRTIVVVCRSGNRSDLVTRALRDAGYRAENLDGAMKAGARAGLGVAQPGGRIV